MAQGGAFQQLCQPRWATAAGGDEVKGLCRAPATGVKGGRGRREVEHLLKLYYGREEERMEINIY